MTRPVRGDKDNVGQVRDDLLAMAAADQQAAHACYEASQKLEAHRGKFIFELPRSEWLAEYDEAYRRAAEHVTALRAIINRLGWPGYRQVGRDGEQAAWLIVQHAGLVDPDFQASCVPLLASRVAEGEADPHHLAALVDRVELEAGRLQLYGTHLEMDEKGGLRPVRGVAQPESLDERRNEIGLNAWADYLDDCRSGRPEGTTDAG